jgi:hypothetical protein
LTGRIGFDQQPRPSVVDAEVARGESQTKAVQEVQQPDPRVVWDVNR